MGGAGHRPGARLKQSRIGLLGGSFNPAHGGHRAISLFAIRALGLDELWWLVSPGNPLKDPESMAPLKARLASARKLARGARIVPTAIEADLGTRYTADTIAALKKRYPMHRFVWLMGADNLLQFHHWRRWREIARAVPIAVIARPGYNHAARAAPALGWLRRFVRPAADVGNWTDWRPPALVLLRFVPDPRSATRIRQADPHWHRRAAPSVAPTRRTHSS
ncbi:nicotinate-nucleotide adenylyltransferase [Sphingomonas tabacisoli]|uniref:Probable nicotinate-nucleotide adenylyltransferase n=1 Tax=Sphingomonas tabacisoli TaxID=2249466 RepID=A0ABW4I4W2_9SPHN